MKKRNSFINGIKKFWNFIWNGEGILSWITFLIVIFIFIKFIFFPTMSLITGTTLPIVIVESCSMYHDTRNFDSWWESNGEWYEDNNIDKEQFNEFPLRNGFNKGDIFFVRGIKKDNIELGDTIIFLSGSARPIIHRVVDLSPLSTKGDNNAGQFTSSNNPSGINEQNIKDNQIIGKATFVRIPYLGWIKLIFYEPLRTDENKGFCR